MARTKSPVVSASFAQAVATAKATPAVPAVKAAMPSMAAQLAKPESESEERKTVITDKVRKAIAAAVAKELITSAKLAAETDALIQKAVDLHIIAADVRKAEYLKGNARSNPARAEVKEMFESLFPGNTKTAAQYQSCFWLAFETGTPFSRSALNTKSKAKAEAQDDDEGEGEGTAKAKGADQNKVTKPSLTQGQLIDLVTQECAKSDKFKARLLAALADCGVIELA